MRETRHTIENPVTGHRVTLLQTADETSSELLQIEYVVPGREEPLQYIPLHLHAIAEERFEVKSGCLGFMIDDKDNRRTLAPGQDVVISPGTVHAFWNAGDDELRFITDVWPTGRLQTYWETAFGLAAEGKVNEKGIIHFWQLAALFPVMDTYAPGPPAWLQRVIFKPLGWIGHLLAYRVSYSSYDQAAANNLRQAKQA